MSSEQWAVRRPPLSPCLGGRAMSNERWAVLHEVSPYCYIALNKLRLSLDKNYAKTWRTTALWHLGIAYLTLHSGIENTSSNCTQGRFCAILNERVVHYSFNTVQRCNRRTTKQPQDVRPDTLMPYVLRLYERTSADLTPYVQRISFG